MMYYYSFRLMIRDSELNNLHRAERLFYQYCVDQCVKIKTQWIL